MSKLLISFLSCFILLGITVLWVWHMKQKLGTVMDASSLITCTICLVILHVIKESQYPTMFFFRFHCSEVGRIHCMHCCQKIFFLHFLLLSKHLKQLNPSCNLRVFLFSPFFPSLFMKWAKSTREPKNLIFGYA